jgi:hypothetical protein
MLLLPPPETSGRWARFLCINILASWPL